MGNKLRQDVVYWLFYRAKIKAGGLNQSQAEREKKNVTKAISAIKSASTATNVVPSETPKIIGGSSTSPGSNSSANATRSVEVELILTYPNVLDSSGSKSEQTKIKEAFVKATGAIAGNTTVQLEQIKTTRRRLLAVFYKAKIKAGGLNQSQAESVKKNVTKAMNAIKSASAATNVVPSETPKVVTGSSAPKPPNGNVSVEVELVFSYLKALDFSTK